MILSNAQYVMDKEEELLENKRVFKMKYISIINNFFLFLFFLILLLKLILLLFDYSLTFLFLFAGGDEEELT